MVLTAHWCLRYFLPPRSSIEISNYKILLAHLSALTNIQIVSVGRFCLDKGCCVTVRPSVSVVMVMVACLEIFSSVVAGL